MTAVVVIIMQIIFLEWRSGLRSVATLSPGCLQDDDDDKDDADDAIEYLSTSLNFNRYSCGFGNGSYYNIFCTHKRRPGWGREEKRAGVLVQSVEGIPDSF